MDLQRDYIAGLTALARDDSRVRAAWLEGSLGKGIADRWSDVDAHLLVEPGTLDEFREGVRAWLETIRPLVLFRLMFNGQMVNAMTDEALRLDVWLHAGDRAPVVEGQAQVLYAQGDVLAWRPNPGEVLSQQAAAAELERAIPEFWRCIAMLPVAIGRNEKIVGAAGCFLILLLLTDVLSVQSGRRKDRGVKAINGFLPPEYHRLVEDAVYLKELTLIELARFQLRLAAVMQAHGPAICARWQVEYPHALEDAVLRYISAELHDLGLAL